MDTVKECESDISFTTPLHIPSMANVFRLGKGVVAIGSKPDGKCLWADALWVTEPEHIADGMQKKHKILTGTAYII